MVATTAVEQQCWSQADTYFFAIFSRTGGVNDDYFATPLDDGLYLVLAGRFVVFRSPIKPTLRGWAGA